MGNYELTFIVRQNMANTEVENLTDNYVKFIESKDGQILKRESWGLRSLAYPIKGNLQGNYIYLKIDIAAALIADLEKKLKAEAAIIRYLIVKLQVKNLAPAANE